MATQAQYNAITAQAVGYWPCNEGSGDVVANVNGTECQGVRNTITGLWDSDGIEDSCIKYPQNTNGVGNPYDGDTASIRITNGTVINFPTGNFSYSFWLKRQAGAGIYSTLDRATSIKGYIFGVDLNGKPTTYIRFNAADGTFVELNGDTAVDDGEWHHLAYTVDRAGFLRIYVDGVEDASVDISAFTNDIGSSVDLLVQLQGFGVVSSQDVFVDEICAFDRVLTPEEVVILASLPVSQPTLTESMSSWFHFEYDEWLRIGKPIPANLKTGRLNFNSNVVHKRLHSASVIAQTTGTTLDATIDLNGGQSRQTATLDLGLGRIAEDAINNDWLIWNLGTWDDDKWAEKPNYTFKAYRRLPVHTKGINAQLDLHANHAQDLKLSGVNLYYRNMNGAH